jgi:hypothetical protein
MLGYACKSAATFMSELRETNQSAKNVTAAVHQTIITKLTSFTDQLGPKHDKSITAGMCQHGDGVSTALSAR